MTRRRGVSNAVGEALSERQTIEDIRALLRARSSKSNDYSKPVAAQVQDFPAALGLAVTGPTGSLTMFRSVAGGEA